MLKYDRDYVLSRVGSYDGFHQDFDAMFTNGQCPECGATPDSASFQAHADAHWPGGAPNEAAFRKGNRRKAMVYVYVESLGH